MACQPWLGNSIGWKQEMQKTMCYFLQSNTCIIFRLQTQQVVVWSFASVNLSSNLCSGSVGFCAWTHCSVQRQWLRFMSASADCQGICTKPAAPLPSSSTWAMLNRVLIEKWGPDSSPCPPFLLQAMNPTFHGHSAIPWSPRELMDRPICKSMGRSVWGETDLISKNQKQHESSIDLHRFRFSCILAWTHLLTS